MNAKYLETFSHELKRKASKQASKLCSPHEGTKTNLFTNQADMLTSWEKPLSNLMHFKEKQESYIYQQDKKGFKSKRKGRRRRRSWENQI